MEYANCEKKVRGNENRSKVAQKAIKIAGNIENMR